MTCQSLFGVGEGLAAGVADGLAEDLGRDFGLAGEGVARTRERTVAMRKKGNRGAFIGYSGCKIGAINGIARGIGDGWMGRRSKIWRRRAVAGIGDPGVVDALSRPGSPIPATKDGITDPEYEHEQEDWTTGGFHP